MRWAEADGGTRAKLRALAELSAHSDDAGSVTGQSRLAVREQPSAVTEPAK